MGHKYTLMHPDIGSGSGRTKELIDELVSLYNAGCPDGAEEILGLVNLLSNDDNLSRITLIPQKGSAAEKLTQSFASIVSELSGPLSDFVMDLLRSRGWSDIPLHIGSLGSATGTIFAALRANGIDSGDVITTSLNYVGVPNAISLAGARPKFVDIDPHSWCMDPASLEAALDDNTKAVVLTHVNRFLDLKPYHEALSDKGLDIPVIQDASLSPVSTCAGMKPGLINLGSGGITIVSLAPSKIMSGLGGAVFTSHDLELMNRIIEIGYQGLSLNDQSYIEYHGSNLRMNEMSAQVAVEQMKRRDDLIAKRKRLKELYDEHLDPAVKEGKVVLQDTGDEAVITHYMVLLPDRQSLAEKLYRKHNIFLYMWHVHHDQKIYEDCKATLPVTEDVEKKLTLLPFHNKLTESDVEFICKSIIDEI